MGRRKALENGSTIAHIIEAMKTTMKKHILPPKRKPRILKQAEVDATLWSAAKEDILNAGYTYQQVAQWGILEFWRQLNPKAAAQFDEDL